MKAKGEESPMKYLLSLILLMTIPLVLSTPIFADTVLGMGGVSPAISGFSGTSFQWIDDTGGVDASVLSNVYGYSVLASGQSVTGAGSLLLSNPFTVDGTNTLDVSFSLFTAEGALGSNFNELGFAVLLRNSQMVAVLGAYRPDGINHITDIGNVQAFTFSGPSSGVTTTRNTHQSLSDLPVMTLGSEQYGVSADLSSCFVNCLTDVTSSYTPTVGTYQILYGSFFLDSNPNPHAAGLAVKTVKVPEPTPVELGVVALGLIGTLILALRRKLHNATTLTALR
jgi:hypothetical protein